MKNTCEMMEESTMDARKIREKIEALHNEVYRQMVDETKNTYDYEVGLPQCEKMEISLKTNYNLESREDTPKNKKRREKRPGKLEEKIAKDCIDETKEMIKEQYYVSITMLSQHDNWLCNEKTARKLLKCLFTMIGYKNVDRIPKILAVDVITLTNKWIEHTKSLYKCCEAPEKTLDCMNTEEMLLTYDVYLLAKTMILIDCNNETDYREKTTMLHTNNRLNALYAAARVLKK